MTNFTSCLFYEHVLLIPMRIIMKKYIILAVFSSLFIISGCAETAVTVPADAIVCSKASGCS